MGGHPCIRAMRITVRRVLEILGAYPDRVELLKDYRDLQAEDVQQALIYGTIDLNINAA